VPNGFLGIEDEQTNGLVVGRGVGNRIDIRGNKLRHSLHFLQSGGLLTYETLYKIQELFEFSIRGEYSGWIDQNNFEDIYTINDAFKAHSHGDPNMFYILTPMYKVH